MINFCSIVPHHILPIIRFRLTIFEKIKDDVEKGNSKLRWLQIVTVSLYHQDNL